MWPTISSENSAAICIQTSVSQPIIPVRLSHKRPDQSVSSSVLFDEGIVEKRRVRCLIESISEEKRVPA